MKRTKGRHGAGRKSADISTSIPKEIDAKLRELAQESELTRGGYAREAIIDAVRRKFVRRVVRETVEGKIVKIPTKTKTNAGGGAQMAS